MTVKRKTQCKTDFRPLKQQALQHNCLLQYHGTEQPEVYFAVNLGKWSCLLSTCISASKYEDSIQFLLVYSSKNYVYFKLFFGLCAMLLDR